jgi:hypothetical protein
MGGETFEKVGVAAERVLAGIRERMEQMEKSKEANETEVKPEPKSKPVKLSRWGRDTSKPYKLTRW